MASLSGYWTFSLDNNIKATFVLISLEYLFEDTNKETINVIIELK